MLQFGTCVFNTAVQGHELVDVDCLPSLCQKLSELVEIWRS